jgi:hypothetical protein
MTLGFGRDWQSRSCLTFKSGLAGKTCRSLEGGTCSSCLMGGRFGTLKIAESEWNRYDYSYFSLSNDSCFDVFSFPLILNIAFQLL